MLCGWGQVLVRTGVGGREVSEVLERVGGCGGNGGGAQLVRGVVCCVTCDSRDRSVCNGCISLVENAGMRVTCKVREVVSYEVGSCMS